MFKLNPRYYGPYKVLAQPGVNRVPKFSRILRLKNIPGTAVPGTKFTSTDVYTGVDLIF
eukprot:SAG31_NODE_754_length_12324_cov_3.930061_9_plen_59_part_00